MHQKHDTLTSVRDSELSKNDIDTMFEHMTDLYETRKELADGFGPESRKLELQAIRDGILAELLEHRPEEAISEVVHTLALLYENRSVVTEYDDATVTTFATRDKSNKLLDDRFEVITYHDGKVVLYCSFISYPGSGEAVSVSGEEVGTYTLVLPSYKIPRFEDDGSHSPHQETLRTFYLRSLSTAGFVLNRRLHDPEEADRADMEAKAMLIAHDTYQPRTAAEAMPRPRA